MAGTLKAFLVKVGFDVDTASQKKYDDAVKKSETKQTKDQKEESKKRAKADVDDDKAREKRRKDEEKRTQDRTKRVNDSVKNLANSFKNVALTTAAVVSGVELSALGIAYAVDRAAKGFERLNYVSKRAGASARGTTAFGYAASQLGSDASTAESSLAEFGQNLKMYRGYRDALQHLIGNIYDKNGSLQDTSGLATRLGTKLAEIRRTRGPAAAQARAGASGFDDYNLQQAMMDPSFAGMEAARKEQMDKVGSNPDKAAEASTAFEKSMRHLNSVFEDVGTKIETALVEKLGPHIDELADFLADNSTEISDFVVSVAKGVLDLVTAFAESKELRSNIRSFIDGVKGLSKDADGSEPMKEFAKNINLITHAIGAAYDWLKAKLGFLMTGAEANKIPGSDTGDMLQMNPGGTGGTGFGEDGRSTRAGLGSANLKDYKSGGKPIGPGAFTSKAPNIADRLKADFPGMTDDDASAILGNLGHESGGFTQYGEKGGGSGIGWAQWTGSRHKEFLEWAAANGLDPHSDEANYGMLKHDLKGRYAGALAKTMATSGLMNKTVTFEGGYEGAGVKNYGSRYRYALAARAAKAARDAQNVTAAATQHPSVAPALTLAQRISRHAAGIKVDAEGYALNPDGSRTMSNYDPRTGTVTAPLGPSSSSVKGDTNVTHNPTFNITGPDLAAAMSAARQTASRGTQDLLRNVQGAEQ